MITLNRVQLLGRLGADPEVHEKYSLLVLAVDGLKDETCWLRIVFGSKSSVLRYLKKGSRVFIEGKLYQRRTPDSVYLNVAADTVILLDRPERSE